MRYLESALLLLEEQLIRGSLHKNSDPSRQLKMGRIYVDLPDDLEKRLKVKIIERTGGKKGYLTRTDEETIKA
jgi:hypothetical protein